MLDVIGGATIRFVDPEPVNAYATYCSPTRAYRMSIAMDAQAYPRRRFQTAPQRVAPQSPSGPSGNFGSGIPFSIDIDLEPHDRALCAQLGSPSVGRAAHDVQSPSAVGRRRSRLGHRGAAPRIDHLCSHGAAREREPERDRVALGSAVTEAIGNKL